MWRGKRLLILLLVLATGCEPLRTLSVASNGINPLPVATITQS